MRFCVTEVKAGCSLEILNEVVLSCAIRLGNIMKTVRYAVRYTVTFGVRSYPSRVWDMVTTSAVTSVV